MSYPTRLLSPGETIVYELRPHWRALIAPTIVLILLAFAGTWLYFLTDSAILRWVVLGAGVGLLLLWVVLPLLRWLTTQYVFTDRRIIIRRGLITKQGRDVPLAKVNNVAFNQSVLGRMFNFGELQIESANTDGSLYIEDVPDVEDIQRDVYRLQEEDDARRRTSGGGTTPVLPSDGT
jgi:uncharacterized membrane protein YdbT with pleckstrin-like domain